MLSAKTNDLNEVIATNKSPESGQQASECQAQQNDLSDQSTTLTQRSHAARLTEALEKTGLVKRLNHYASECLIYVFCGSDTYEHVQYVDDVEDLLSQRLFAARYFPDHESYEIIGFEAFGIEVSGSTKAFQVEIEVIAEISFCNEVPVLSVLFEDADFPINLRLMPNESSVLLCQDCLDSKIGVVDAFFEPTIRFLKEVVLDPRSENIFWQI